jgi:hypothetical protein
MGNQVSLIPKVSYEDIQMVVYRNSHVQHSTLLINTLPPSLQHCLIKTTLDIRFEERVVNALIHKNPDIMIIVYGKNSNDITLINKYDQLVKLGFTNVHIYTGGIFEWMLLHEIYGKDLFKITKYEIDILRYRPKSVLLAAMVGGGGGGGDGGVFIEDGGGDGLGGGGGESRYPRDYIHEDIDNNEDDIRIHISDEMNGRQGLMGGGVGGGGGGIIASGIKWLFGT